jgi:hypothetical protein
MNLSPGRPVFSFLSQVSKNPLTRHLLLSALAILALSRPAVAAEPVRLVQTVEVSVGDVLIRRNANVDFITLRGGAIGTEEGMPDLPVKPLTFRLPEEMRIASVDVRILESRQLRGEFHPATIHTRNSDNEFLPLGASATTLPLDGEGYYPASQGRTGRFGPDARRALGGVVYHPFRWRESDGRLEIVTRAELTLTLEPETRDRTNDFVPLRREPWADAMFDPEVEVLVENRTPELEGRTVGTTLSHF